MFSVEAEVNAENRLQTSARASEVIHPQHDVGQPILAATEIAHVNSGMTSAGENHTVV